MKNFTLFAMMAAAVAATSFVSCGTDDPITESEDDLPTVVSVTEVKLNETEIPLYVEDTATLIEEVLPTEATDKSVTWKSNNPAIASVDDDGLVTALTVGTTTITVTTVDGKKTAECKVIVSLAIHPVESVSLSEETMGIALGGKGQLEAEVLPLYATDQSVVWSSAEESIATVTQDGLVEGMALGTTTITVTTNSEGKQAHCTVTVSSLGEMTFTFRTSTTWPVTNGTITQQWSDVVMCEAARGKTAFMGKDGTTFVADLRENEGYGDLYSWTFLDEYADEMCPDEWRVPTMQEFVDLNTAFGGTGVTDMMPGVIPPMEGIESDPVVVAKYSDPAIWGGELAGRVKADGTMERVGDMMMYWSGTEDPASDGFYSHFLQLGMGSASIKVSGDKGAGMNVRCIK